VGKLETSDTCPAVFTGGNSLRRLRSIALVGALLGSVAVLLLGTTAGAVDEEESNERKGAEEP
jgi:hypothetical protein